MEDENYYDFYFRKRDSKKKLRLYTDFHYVDQPFWDASGIIMDNEYFYRVGQIPNTEIDCAVNGTGFYVDPKYHSEAVVDDWAKMVFKKYPKPLDNETRYLKIIEIGESETIEFKSTFKYDIIKKLANNSLTHLISIVVSAFLNSRGGTLFIGVEDNKNIIGLDYDLKILKNIDILQQEIPKTIRNDLGGSGIQFDLEIEQLKGKLVCIISVRPSEKPIFFNNKEYYVRKGTQNQSLNPKETFDHISVRYKNIIVNQEKINKNQEKKLQDFIIDLQEGNYENILNKFNNRDYRAPFESLFTEIERETGAITLISNSFVIAIGVEKIFAIKPIYHRERYPDWNNKLLTDKLKIWLEDFIERVKQVLKLDVS